MDIYSSSINKWHKLEIDQRPDRWKDKLRYIHIVECNSDSAVEWDRITVHTICMSVKGTIASERMWSPNVTTLWLHVYNAPQNKKKNCRFGKYINDV